MTLTCAIEVRLNSNRTYSWRAFVRSFSQSAEPGEMRDIARCTPNRVNPLAVKLLLANDGGAWLELWRFRAFVTA